MSGPVAQHLVVAAAGTGGHVMPGIAVALALRARGWTVSWLGTHAGHERHWVEPQGIEFDAIDFSNVRGKGLVALVKGGVRLIKAMWRARQILRQRRATMLFTTGGYVAVPVGLAAAWNGVPFMLLNADAATLLSTKILRSFSFGVMCGFEGEAARSSGARAQVTGNPVRTEIAAIPEPLTRYTDRIGPLRVLVIGGSLGAQVFNETLPRALAILPTDQRPEVVHQCGAHNLKATQTAYATVGVQAEVVSFINDMGARYAWADVVICRAGAITVAELAAAGVPAILVPFVISTTQHQQGNAEYMAQHDAAIHLPQTELTPQRLCTELRGLTRERLLHMAQTAHRLGRPTATRAVADAIEKVAKEIAQ